MSADLRVSLGLSLRKLAKLLHPAQLQPESHQRPAGVFCMATLVALQERRPGLTEGLGPHHSGSSRHCRAAPAHHAATQWFLLTFHSVSMCAVQNSFFFLLAPSSGHLGATQRDWGCTTGSIGKRHNPDLYLCSCFMISFLNCTSKPRRFIYPPNAGISLAFC